MKKGKGKVVLGMSGGVDSSVAAYLLLKEGYEVIGVTLRLLDDLNIHKRSCCSPEDIIDAGRVADFLNIPHYVLDKREVFRSHIIKKFIEYYKKGKTPNPCIWCNRIIKFSFLLEALSAAGGDYIATGHYSRIIKSEGCYFICEGKDKSKDQSYFLYTLPQEILKFTIFPLGEFTKKEIREIARKNRIPTFRKKESQQACFLPEDGNRAFLEENLGRKDGVFTDEEGNVLGFHSGHWFFTVGQRKGLGVSAGDRLYVKDICAEENKVVLAPRERVYSSFLKVEDFCEVKDNYVEEGKKFVVRIRHKHEGAGCTILKREGKKLIAQFDSPQWAVTPGQSAVFYEGDRVVGGGEIAKW